MPREALELMRVLYGRVTLHEALATQDMRKAGHAEHQGFHNEAEALRTLSRAHRIRVLEDRAHIGLLEVQFGPQTL